MTAAGRFVRWRELAWLNRERLTFYPAALFALYVVFAGLWTALTVTHGMIDPVGIPFGHVFIEFWTAAKAALGPTPSAIYDFPSFYAMQKAVIAAVRPLYPWHYPPVLLLFLLPFALLPYLWAVPLWYAAGLAAYLTLGKRLALERHFLWLGLAFPGALLTLHTAHFGLLLVAAFGWGLLLLERRPFVAGAFIALLAVKPHLFLLVPLALLVSRRWAVFSAATLGVLLLIAASSVVFGADIWLALFDNIRAFGHAQTSLRGTTGLNSDVFILWNWQPSAFVMARQLGLGSPLAYLAQGAFALAGAVAVVWAWRSPAPQPLKSSALVVANLLATPYVYNYDLVLLILPIAWLGWHGARHGWLRGEKLALLLAWLFPGLVIPLAALLGMQIGAVLIAAFLFVICRRIACEGSTAKRAACA